MLRAFIGLLVFWALLYFSWRQMRRVSLGKSTARTRELSTLYAEMGWTLDPSWTDASDSTSQLFECFRHRWEGSALCNTATGVIRIRGQDCPVRIGDFTWKVVGLDINFGQVGRLSYILIQPPASVPDLTLRPRTALDSVTDAIAAHRVCFPSDALAKRSVMTGVDPALTSCLSNPRMVEFLQERIPSSLEVRDGSGLVHSDERPWTVNEFRERLAWLTHFFELWDLVPSSPKVGAQCH